MTLKLVDRPDEKNEVYYHLHATMQPSIATYETNLREDYYEEFIRSVNVELKVTDYGTEVGDDGVERTVAEFAGIVVRHRCIQDGIDMFDMSDAHSGEAANVSFYLTENADQEFFDRFDTSPEYANVLLVENVEWEGATTAEIRQFVRRSVEQFDVDLVFIELENTALAEHFRVYFEEDGPFLIHSMAHTWPEVPEMKAEA